MPGIDLSRAVAPETPDAQPLQDHAYGNLDYMQAPAKGPVDDTLGQLAQSLGQFNSHLEQFGKYWAENQRPDPRLLAKQNKADMDAAGRFVDTHTHAEFQEAVKAGTAPRFASPLANEYLQQNNGRYTAESLGKEVSAKVASGELTPEQMPQYLARRRQEILKTNGWTDNTPQAQGFGDHFNRLNESAAQQATAATIKAKNDQFNDWGYKTMDLAAIEARKGGGDVTRSQTLFDAVRKQLVTIVHFKPAEVDAMQMDILGRYAQTDPNWAYKMATTPRKDVSTGAVIPPLGDNPKFQDRVAQFGFSAQKYNAGVESQNIARDVGMGDLAAFKTADGSAAARTANPAAVVNRVDGTLIDLKPDQRQKQMVQSYLIDSQATAQRLRETPEQTFNRDADAFIGNNTKNPAWSQQIDSAPAAANPVSMSDPRQRARLVAAAQTYARLTELSPAYVASHFDEKARSFFDAYWILKQSAVDNGHGWDDVRALTAASAGIGATKGGALGDRFSSQVDKFNLEQLVNAKADQLATYGGTVGGFFASKAENVTEVRKELTKLSTVLANATGMEPQAAVQQAGDYLSKSATVRDGRWMRRTNLLGSGSDDAAYNTASERLLTQFAEKTHGEYKRSDLALTDVGGGQYRITKRNGMPVEAGGVTFARADLLRALSAAHAADAQKHIDAQHRHAQSPNIIAPVLDESGRDLTQQ